MLQQLHPKLRLKIFGIQPHYGADGGQSQVNIGILCSYPVPADRFLKEQHLRRCFFCGELGGKWPVSLLRGSCGCAILTERQQDNPNARKENPYV